MRVAIVLLMGPEVLPGIAQLCESHGHTKDGPLQILDWSKTDEGWTRHQYRMSDDAADDLGHPYLVAYIQQKVESEHFLHFYRAQGRGVVALLIGDEAGNTYGIERRRVKQVVDFFVSMQQKWCEKYHHSDCPPERDVTDNFKSLGDLIEKIKGRFGDTKEG